MSPGNAVYQAAMSGFKQFPNPNMLQLQQQQYNKMVLASGVRARGRTVLPGQRFPGMVPSFPTTLPNQTSGGLSFTKLIQFNIKKGVNYNNNYCLLYLSRYKCVK